MEYVKINSLWKRQEYVKGLPKGTHGPLIVGQYSEPEFGNIKKWCVTESFQSESEDTCFSLCAAKPSIV